MSLIKVKTSWADWNPAVKVNKYRLLLRSSFLAQLFTLFSMYTQILVVKPEKKIIVLKRRYWIWFRKIVLDFNDIEYLDYTYSRYGTSWGISEDGWSRFNNIEFFNISAKLKNSKCSVKLITFWGRGVEMTGLFGVMCGDSVVDFEGEQENISRNVLDLLIDMIGVPLRNHIHWSPAAKGFADQPSCPRCGRINHHTRVKCMHCGFFLRGADKKEDEQ